MCGFQVAGKFKFDFISFQEGIEKRTRTAVCGLRRDIFRYDFFNTLSLPEL
jgi:hypothetical protein